MATEQMRRMGIEDVSIISKLGWQPKVSLKQGLEKTYAWFSDQTAVLRD